jgi:hypothetical protein
MTDRLTKWLDIPYRSEEREAQALRALRAVVGLHQNKPGVYKFFCQACEYRSNIAPCPTIRAIEKEVIGE